MCWQCGNKPHQWLSIFDSFYPSGWWFGPGTGDGVFEFELEGISYYTNPFCNIVEWMIDHIPGEIDQDGTPWFIEGKYSPQHENWFREKF